MSKINNQNINENNKKDDSTYTSGTYFEETYFKQREKLNTKSKRAIAQQIVNKFLHEGDSILLDAGTSCFPIAEEIAEKAKNNPASTHYTIITHNYAAFPILIEPELKNANLNIVLTGGRYDSDLNALFGPQTIMSYENFFPRVVLIAVSSMMADQGLFCHGNTEELEVKKEIFRKPARDRIIVADYTKLGVVDALRFGTSQKLRANVDNCIVVTDEPSKDVDKNAREKFKHEIDTLRNTYEVQVEIVTAL